MTRWPAVTTLVLGAFAAPAAAADPGQLPDLSGYTAVDVRDYATYYNYPTTNGAQFVSPGGYRCRITYTGRANPPVKAAACWGALPGTPFNSVGVQAEMATNPAEFGNSDLARMEQYRAPPGDSPPRTFSPESYRPLPAGSKLSYCQSATCAVTDAMTVCELGEHGFVLDPNGSRAF
jgi:hypothetical protein